LDQENQPVDTIEFDDAALVALIRKAGEGDTTAFTALYDSTSSLIFGLVLRFLPERAIAEEILLDIYTHVWKESADYDPRKFMPLEWLVTIARDRSILKLDATKESKKRSVTEADRSISPTTVAPSIQKLARASLDSLTATQIEALDWAFYTGLSCSEVAVQNGQPFGAVKTHTRIGMSKLYDLFSPLYERETGLETAKGRQDIEPRKTE